MESTSSTPVGHHDHEGGASLIGVKHTSGQQIHILKTGLSRAHVSPQKFSVAEPVYEVHDVDSIGL